MSWALIFLLDVEENGNSPSPATPASLRGRHQESDSKWKIFVEAGVRAGGGGRRHTKKEKKKGKGSREHRHHKTQIY